jgi:hypothetical protein|tara:strand:- start:272 stop:544 length:273 start_codon:yes stop_codon:yes gene_type:complete
VRKLHAEYDPHKRLHEQNKTIFVKVIQTVMKRSASEYFEELMVLCNMYGEKQNEKSGGKKNEEDVSEAHGSAMDTSPIELACLVELSNSV